MKRTIELRTEFYEDQYEGGQLTINIDDADISVTNNNATVAMPHADFDLVCEQLILYRKMVAAK